MKIAICDDILEDREHLIVEINNFAAKYKAQFSVLNFSDGKELLQALKKHTFQVIFLDIYMDGFDGMKVAKEIRKFDESVQIVFTTNSKDHGIEGFRVRALHYLLKPVLYCDIEQVLNLCQANLAKRTLEIQVTGSQIATEIMISSIIYAEIFEKLMAIHTVHRVYHTRMTMETLVSLLNGKPFLRCHRSYIINMDYIRSVTETDFILTNDECVPIGKKNRMSIKKVYGEYLFEQMGVEGS